jgi:hypothetical protein
MNAFVVQFLLYLTSIPKSMLEFSMHFKTTLRAAQAVVCAFGLGVCVTAQAAALSWFTDRAAWEAAAGTPTFTEDFSGFSSDLLFQTAPVALNGMTIVQQGVDDFRNLVDVAPLEFADNNGTAHASMYTNSGAITAQIAFNALTSAFGGQTWEAASGEGARVVVLSGSDVLGSVNLTDAGGAFFGFVVTGGSATSIRFESVTDAPGSAGEGFGLDNLAGRVAGQVPAPGALALLGIGLAGLAAARRRR